MQKGVSHASLRKGSADLLGVGIMPPGALDAFLSSGRFTRRSPERHPGLPSKQPQETYGMSWRRSSWHQFSRPGPSSHTGLLPSPSVEADVSCQSGTTATLLGNPVQVHGPDFGKNTEEDDSKKKNYLNFANFAKCARIFHTSEKHVRK